MFSLWYGRRQEKGAQICFFIGMVRGFSSNAGIFFHLPELFGLVGGGRATTETHNQPAANQHVFDLVPAK